MTTDYRRQLADFAAGITRPLAGMKSPNLGPGYEFHYRPDHRDSASSNLDTPEYANITIQALAFYEQALRLGMRRCRTPRSGGCARGCCACSRGRGRTPAT